MQREADQWRPTFLIENAEIDENTGKPTTRSVKSLLAKFRESLEKQKKFEESVINKIAQLKF
jgi:hypothetical protein